MFCAIESRVERRGRNPFGVVGERSASEEGREVGEMLVSGERTKSW